MQRRIRDLAVLKDDLRARVDMVAYIGRTIELSQRGGNWFGLCPFHSETTPSFNVTPGKGTGVWSCLGCRESGDLFTFVQQTESCNFLDALKKIAEDVGFDLNAYYRELTAEEEEREGQFAFMSQVADVLHQQLLTFPQHVRFFTDRGINVETLEKFKIGFCPSYAFFEALIPDPQAQIVVEANEPTRRNIFDGT